MRGLEDHIDINETHADDFRLSVICKWATQVKNLMPKPSWRDDCAMKDAITLSINNSMSEANHPHLGKREFDDGQLVMFTTTCNLEYYQEKEEEVRSREVKQYTKGRIYCAIAQFSEEMAKNPRYKDFNEIVPNSGRGYEEVHIQSKCICSMDTLMSTGCKCGHLEKHENSRQ